jgi:RNA polymerase sigma factor (sigma-70 family)
MTNLQNSSADGSCSSSGDQRRNRPLDASVVLPAEDATGSRCINQSALAFRAEAFCTLVLLLSSVVALSFTAATAEAFSVQRNSIAMYATEPTRLTTKLLARPSEMVQQLEPRTNTSDERRKRAVAAMDRKNVESVVAGLDANLLSMLTDQFLYNPDQASAFKARKRPNNRPESVPAAMRFETMVRYRERKNAIKRFQQHHTNPISAKELAVIAPYVDKGSGSSEKAEKINSSSTFSSSSADVVTIEKTLPSAISKAAKNSVSRVFRNLQKESNYDPVLEALLAEDKGRRRRGTRNQNKMDLHKYYQTGLLTAAEEYATGMKVQFMGRCEEVHEGLAAKLDRLPTIEEWAAACGFVEPHDLFVATEADEQLRPVGSATMFDDIDPTMFVGNGLAQDSGPGRGRGRVKKAPAVSLKNFYDDSQYHASLQAYEANKGKDPRLKRPSRKDLKPINRGTPTDFVEMLMAAKEAKQLMVQSNMRLVVSIARKHCYVGVSLQDLVQEGSLGLTRAAEKFEPQKGFKFSTYASWWIQQAVFRAIAYHSRTIRLPVHIHNLLNRIRKVRQGLDRDLGRTPSNQEIADQLGMTLSKYNKMIHLTKRSISLETPLYQSNPKDLGHESDDTLRDCLDSESMSADDSPEKRVDQGLFLQDLQDMMQILNEDERLVISARYGLQDGLTRTVNSVATELKQSKAWVQSQEARALRKLRRPWYERKLKEHQDALID